MTAACYVGLPAVSKNSHRLPQFLPSVSDTILLLPLSSLPLLWFAHISIFGSQTFSSQPLAHQRGEPFVLLEKGVTLLPSLFSSRPEAELPKAQGWAWRQKDLPCSAQHSRRARPLLEAPSDLLRTQSWGTPGAPAYLSVNTDARTEQIAGEIIHACIFNRQVVTCSMFLHNLLFESSKSCPCS